MTEDKALEEILSNVGDEDEKKFKLGSLRAYPKTSVYGIICLAFYTLMCSTNTKLQVASY